MYPYEYYTTIDLKYNELTPDSIINNNNNNNNTKDNDENDIQFNQIIKIQPNTITLKQLRNRLCKICNINDNELVIRKNYHDQELKDVNLRLKKYGIPSIQRHIYIERGHPLQPNQTVLQIMIPNELKQKTLLHGFIREQVQIPYGLHIPQMVIQLCFEFMWIIGDQPLVFIGQIIVEHDCILFQLKQNIAQKFRGKVPSSKKMRLRDFSNQRLTRVLRDDLTIKQCLGGNLIDYKQICCQAISAKSINVYSRDHILLQCIRWYPSERRLGSMEEIVFLKRCTVLDGLKDELAQISNLERDNISYTLTFPHKINTYLAFNNSKKKYSKCSMYDRKDEMLSFRWLVITNELVKSSTLVSAPWRCRDGDIIIYTEGGGVIPFPSQAKNWWRRSHNR